MMTEPTPEVRHALSARARETVADMLRTYEQVMNANQDESAGWLKNQIDQVRSLRSRKKGEGQ